MSFGLTLALDGSTYAGSVAVIRDTTVVASHQLASAPTPGRGGREENFMPMVAQCLEDAAVTPRELDRIVCGSGPGSFTSLRIAASIAKGIATGAECPLFAVSSLMLIVAANLPPAGRYLATLPAMRGEVFGAFFEVMEKGGISELGPPVIIADSAVESEAKRESAQLIGAPAIPHARGVASVIASVIASGMCDIDTWEPTYGRLAEAQVRWEAAHGRALTAAE